MNKVIKDKKGFTLIEIIFSIAFLSIVSVIVLKLFVVSYEIENKTDLMDMASIYAINEIENIKNLEIVNEDIEVNKYYDVKWSETLEENAEFVVKLALRKDDTYSRGLYDIEVLVLSSQSSEPLLEIKTKHYYHGKE